MHEQSNKRSGTRLKTERETGKRRFLSPHTPHGRVRIARFVRVDSHATLYRFLYWFWEKNRLFCSLHCSTLFIRQCDQMCVFMGNLSSKTLKYHISLMTYDLKFLLLWERGGIRWLLMRVLQKQLRVLPRWFRYCLSWSFLRSTFQYYTCQLFLSQMREIFTLSWPGFPEMSRPLLKIYDDFPKTSERCRKCPQIFRRRLSTSEAT